MFEMIDPCNPSENRTVIDSYLDKIRKHKNLSALFDESKESTLLIMSDESHKMYGGAYLVKKKISSLEKKISKNLPLTILQSKEAWTCTVYLHIDNENLFTEFECFSKKFYVELYKKLSEFGHNEGIDYLSVILVPGEYLCTEVLGFWPYVVEVRPCESEDGLFHGILSLHKSKPKANPKTWEAYLSEYNRLAA